MRALPSVGLMARSLSARLERLAKIVEGLRENLAQHDRDCDDWVSLIALHPDDLDDLKVVEMWGIPVVGWDDVPLGNVRILCEGKGFAVPEYSTFEELQETWKYALPRPEPMLDQEVRSVDGSGAPSSSASSTNPPA